MFGQRSARPWQKRSQPKRNQPEFPLLESDEGAPILFSGIKSVSVTFPDTQVIFPPAAMYGPPGAPIPPLALFLRKSSTMSQRLQYKIEQLPSEVSFTDIRPVLLECLDNQAENYEKARSIMLTSTRLPDSDLFDKSRLHKGSTLAEACEPFFEIVRNASLFLRRVVEFEFEDPLIPYSPIDRDDSEEEEAVEDRKSEIDGLKAMLDNDAMLRRDVDECLAAMEDEFDRCEIAKTHSMCQCNMCKSNLQKLFSKDGRSALDIVQMAIKRIAEDEYPDLKPVDIYRNLRIGKLRPADFSMASLKRVMMDVWKVFHTLHPARWEHMRRLVEVEWPQRLGPNPKEE